MRLMPVVDMEHGRVKAAQDHPGDEEDTVGGQCRRWQAAGFTWVHLTDLDAARGGRAQWSLITQALGRRLRVQFGGGVRSMTQVQQLLELGVDRVVVGTQAIRNPLWLRELCRIFPGHIVLALDAHGRDVLTDGRSLNTGLDLVSVARQLDDAGVAAMVHTAVDGHGDVTAPDPAIVHELRQTLKTPLMVGGAASPADLAVLDSVHVWGATLGTALYAGAIDGAAARQAYPDTVVDPPARRRSEARDLVTEHDGHEDDDEPAEPGDGLVYQD